MLIAFPRKPGPQSVLTIGVLPSSLPLALLLCLFLVGQNTPCLLMGLRQWVNWKEGHVTATKEWQQLSSVIPLTTTLSKYSSSSSPSSSSRSHLISVSDHLCLASLPPPEHSILFVPSLPICALLRNLHRS